MLRKILHKLMGKKSDCCCGECKPKSAVKKVVKKTTKKVAKKKK